MKQNKKTNEFKKEALDKIQTFHAKVTQQSVLQFKENAEENMYRGPQRMVEFVEVNKEEGRKVYNPFIRVKSRQMQRQFLLTQSNMYKKDAFSLELMQTLHDLPFQDILDRLLKIEILHEAIFVLQVLLPYIFRALRVISLKTTKVKPVDVEKIVVVSNF